MAERFEPDTKPRGAYWSVFSVVPWPRGLVPLNRSVCAGHGTELTR